MNPTNSMNDFEDRQKVFPFVREDRIYYTNLGVGEKIDQALKEASKDSGLLTEV